MTSHRFFRRRRIGILMPHDSAWASGLRSLASGLWPPVSGLWPLASILALALALRLWGVNFGLPYLYHPDEPPRVIIAQNMLKTGDLNPHFFNWPSLYLYLNALAYIPYYLVGKALGIFATPADIAAPIEIATGVGMTPLPSTFLLGRTLTACFGAGAAALAYLAARRLTGDTRIGLLAGLLMAVSPANVANSRYITPDTFLMFFLMLSFWASAGVWREGRTRDYIVAAMAAGLAGSSKYNGSTIALALVAAHFLRYGWRGIKDPRLYLAGFLSIASFLLTTPYALLDYPAFLKAFRYEIDLASRGKPGLEGDTVTWYLTYLWQFEGPLFMVGLLQLIWGWRRHAQETLLIAVFPLAYFLLINGFTFRTDRQLLPAIPFLILAAAIFLVRLTEGRGARCPSPFLHREGGQGGRSEAGLATSTPTPVRLLAWALIAVCIAVPTAQSMRATIRLTSIDGRATARAWIVDHIPPGSHIALEAYSAWADPQRYEILGLRRITDRKPQWYIDNGYDYLVFGQDMFSRFYSQPQRYASYIAEYEEMFHTFDLVQNFTDGGYQVMIYRVVRR